MQRVISALQNKDQVYPKTEVKKLYDTNSENFEVVKYFVKIHINFTRDGYMLDVKQCFLQLLEGEKVNEQILVQKFSYSKLSSKILLIKIKTFEFFYTVSKFQQLTAAALRNVGTKSMQAPNIMSVLAE